MRRLGLVAVVLVLALGSCSAKPQGLVFRSSPSPETVKSEPGWTSFEQLDAVARTMFDSPHPLDLWAVHQSEAYNCVIGRLLETHPDRATAEHYMALAVADWRRSWAMADAVFFSRPLVRVHHDGGTAYVVALAAACGGVAATKPDPQGHRDK